MTQPDQPAHTGGPTPDPHDGTRDAAAPQTAAAGPGAPEPRAEETRASETEAAVPPAHDGIADDAEAAGPESADTEATADAQASSGVEQDADGAAEPAERSTTVGHVRRAPRYGRFMWVGFLLGVLVSILLVIFTDGESFDDGYADQVGGSSFFADRLSDSNAIGLLVLTFGPLGILLGAAVAYVLDRRSLRRRDRATSGLTDAPDA